MPSKQQALDALFASFRPTTATTGSKPMPARSPLTRGAAVPVTAAVPRPARRKKAAAVTPSVMPAEAPQKKKKKRKTKSGDARRRAKKAKLAAAAAAASATATDTSPTVPAVPTAKRKKKRHRTNAKCTCNRCGRNLQKKNLREHLKKCDGTRPEHNPNHINSRVRKEENKTDGALEIMFANHCAAHGLEGTDTDFQKWSEAMLADPTGTMQKAKQVKSNVASATSLAPVLASAVPEPRSMSAPVRSEFGGKKKTFGSDSDESDSFEGE